MVSIPYPATDHPPIEPQCPMSSQNLYENPLITRYAGRPMAELWSSQRKFSTWRRLWIALAEAQRSLGLNISESQISELSAHVDKIDFDGAKAHEKRLRHDVMAHVHTYGDVCPNARPIIHLGATSCYVTDNTDLILIRDGLLLVRNQLVGTIDALASFAQQHKSLPCLGYTHFQPAQLVTVGKRATLWTYDLLLDLRAIERLIEDLPFLGAKGTTGTQASFLDLFDGDHSKVEALDICVAQAFGFSKILPVTGQTYPRKLDTLVLNALSGLAESAHRFGCDLRLLAHERELEEPYEAEQIGSSAMAYKRNPMRAERMCSIARYLMALPASAAQTAASQWLERTLDDSAVRRITLPQGFLAADALLRLYLNIAPRLIVHQAVISRNISRELPFMATENLLMAGVRAGGDRQDLHERIRVHSLAAASALKMGADRNELLDRLSADPAFASIDFTAALDPANYTGRCAEQVDAFLQTEIEPLRSQYPSALEQRSEVDV
jgi:adenylosuccinate lyase